MCSGLTGSRRCAMLRLSRSGGCGWTGSWHLIEPAFLGTSGFGPLDNVSVLERFEEGARRWSTARGGSVVELHAYALVEQAGDQQLKDQLLAELHRVYPELEPAGIVAEEFLIMSDCPLHGTDPWEQRLTVETPHPRIVLAGDGIRCDFPVALMERAATTGFLAANQLLGSWGVAGHDLWTVPMRSRHRAAPALRRRADESGLAGELAALPQLVAAFGVREVVHPELPGGTPDPRPQQWRQPARDLEAGPIRVGDGRLGDHGPRPAVGAQVRVGWRGSPPRCRRLRPR